MKKQIIKANAHIVQQELLNPYNPISVNLIGAGGTGSQVLTALARMNHALTALDHAGLFVTVYDDDKVDAANLGRQLFATAELGSYKSVALINRINRFFGTNWRAQTIRYDKQSLNDCETASATITISCVDTVGARIEIAKILQEIYHNFHGRNAVRYWLDFGNSRSSGQVVLATIDKIRQPASKKFNTVETLPMVTQEFKELLKSSGQSDRTPSCSLAEALTKQDLFINSALANCGASLLWQMLREGVLKYRGFFMNLEDFRAQPIRI